MFVGLLTCWPVGALRGNESGFRRGPGPWPRKSSFVHYQRIALWKWFRIFQNKFIVCRRASNTFDPRLTEVRGCGVPAAPPSIQLERSIAKAATQATAIANKRRKLCKARSRRGRGRRTQGRQVRSFTGYCGSDVT